MRSAEVRRAERAWLTQGRDGLDALWLALVLLNLVAIAVWPSWDTVPFHLISTGFAVLYALRLWPADPVLWGLGIVIITTVAGIGLDLLHNNESLEEAAEIPLLAAMFVAVVWHANRRIAADRDRQLGRLDAATVLADAERLGLAMDALLENAIRHTRDGDLIQLSVTGGNGLVRIAVSDTGSGIKAGALTRVFDRFRTGTNANGTRGTGLGLALVRAVADAHGGSARVRSVPGEGSEFEITLPAPPQT